MPNELFSRVLKTAPVTVETVQRITGFALVGDNFKINYVEVDVYPDDSEKLVREFTVDRSVSATPEIADVISQITALSETWRQADDDQRAADIQKAADAAALAASQPPVVQAPGVP